jgi:hypothetical protein
MKLRYTYLFFLVISLWVLLKSNSAGRATQTAPMQACAGGGCHANIFTATAAIDSFLIIDRATNLSITQYVPGQNYRVAFFGRATGFGSTPSLPKFGFIADNGGKGTFSGPSSGSTTASTGRYWGHNTKRDSFMSIPAAFTLIYIDTCSWTAPATGSGTVTFNARINAVNNNSVTSGDLSAAMPAKNIVEFTNTASVTATAVGSTTFCAGTSKTFMATPTNPGATPTYQWYKNNAMVGTGGLSYTDAGLANNDSVWVVMTSSIAGITNNPATSNKVKVTVPSFNNIVTIVADKASACAGDTVRFTATPAPGSNPTAYRWYRNMTQIQGPGAPFPAPTMSSAICQVIGLTAGDSFSCRLQVSNLCAVPVNDTSNFVKITVTPSPVITGHINDTICTGDSSKSTNWMSSVSGTTYTWTNSNPLIGLPASGTGPVPKFKTPDAIATAQITGTITIRSFGGGCSGSPVIYTVFVRRKPTIGLTGLSRFYCEGSAGSITVSTPMPGTVSWTNDNPATGIAASGSNGFINFTATNTTSDSLISNITASAYNPTSRCTKDTTFKVIVYPRPTVNSLSNLSPCEGNNVPATNLSSAIPGTSFTWINSNTAIGLAASGTGNIPSFTATNTSSGSIMGTITVSPSFKTCLGANKTFNITVDKNAAPTVSISTNASNLCSGESAFFTATPSGGGSSPIFEWTRNGIIIAGATKDTATITNVQNGDQIVCKMTSSSPCVTSTTATSNVYTVVTISNLVPTIALSTISDTACVGSVLVINTSITNGGTSPSYKWFLNGSPIFGANSDIFFSNTFAMGDEISCEVTSSLGCANPKTVMSTKKTIKVFNPTPTSITLTKSKNKICSEEYVTFTTTFTGGGLNPIVNWKLSNEQMNTNKKFITVPISSSSDVVELRVKSSEPCPTPPYPTLTISVDTVSYGPFVNVSPSPYIAFCEGDSAEVKVLGGQPNYKYNWSNGSTAETFYSKVSNSYTLTITETGNACPSYRGPVTTIANPLPFKPTIFMSNGFLVSTASDRYQWQLNKQDIVAADSMKYKPIIAGNYRVKITNSAGCITFSDEYNPANSGIVSSGNTEKIIIYPNPSNGVFNIQSLDKKIDEVRLVDLTGKTVYQSTVNSFEKEIRLKDVSKGIYFLHLHIDDQNIMQKMEIK